MLIKAFFDPDTATVTYIVGDPETRNCAIIDPVLDYNPLTGAIATKSADQVIDYIKENKLSVAWLLETHIHADHLSAIDYLKGKLGGKTGISEKITDVLKYWIPIFNTGKDTPADGSQFDKLFKDGETFSIGSLPVTVIHIPGHTQACAGYLIKDAIFTGDTIFMPYGGTARTDFPGGDASTLYQSVQRIFNLPDETRIFCGHDYPPEGNAPAWESTVGEQKRKNILINTAITEAQYVETRNKRDHKKPVPRLLLPSIQVNIRAGKLGTPENNGSHYIKIPVNTLGKEQ